MARNLLIVAFKTFANTMQLNAAIPTQKQVGRAERFVDTFKMGVKEIKRDDGNGRSNTTIVLKILYIDPQT